MSGWARQPGWQARFSKGGGPACRWWSAICLVPLLTLVVGCCCFGGRARQERMAYEKADIATGANVFVASMPSPVRVVAVMPFQAETELIGRATSDLFVTEILRAGRYELVERGQLSRVLNEAEVALSGISESEAVALGNMLGADGVIIGTVDEYGTIAQRGRNYPVVGLSVRLIDCESGRVMWSASYAATANDPQTPISQHCRTVVRGTVIALSREWRVQRQVPRQRSPDASIDQPVGRGVAARGAPSVPETPPDVPVYTLSDFGLREVKLQWRDPRVSGLTYRIERATSPNGPFETVDRVAVARETYTDRGTPRNPLADATTYYYRLTAISAGGLESDPGAVRESMTAPPPGPPGNLAADTPAGRAVALTWTPPEDEGISRYIIERASPPDYDYQRVGEATDTHYAEGGTPRSPLADASVYRYRVRAQNRVGAVGEPSPAVEITTRPPPEPVRDSAALSGQPRRVVLSWSRAPEEDVVRYEIERAGGDSDLFTRIASVEGRTHTDYTDRGDESGRGFRSTLVPLQDHTHYRYRIRAVNNVEAFSEWSVVEATTKPVPVMPSDLQAGQGDVNRIALTWKANPEQDIDEYLVSSSGTPTGSFSEAGRAKPGEGVALSWVDEPLLPGVSRYYRIRAVDADGLESAWSEPAPGTTKPVPDAPTGLTAEWDDDGVRLSWTPPDQPDVVRYRLWKQRALRGNTELRVVDEPQDFLTTDEVGRRLDVVVTAIDKDGLESLPSEASNIRSP